MIGDCIRWAISHKVIPVAVRTMLWFYRTTPHSFTGVSPFELLKGRKACSEFRPAWMSKWFKHRVSAQKLDEMVRNKVVNTQTKQKAFFDSRKASVCPVLNTGHQRLLAQVTVASPSFSSSRFR